MEFAGEFETHITVCLNNLDDAKLLHKWSANHGLKCLHIVLDQGATPSQPMLTRHGGGKLTQQLEIAVALCQALKTDGFSAVRIKIEVASKNPHVPQSNIEALSHPCDRYFEHHIKLLLESSADILPLTELAEQHSARLSRNALQTHSDNCNERFINQRCMKMGRVEAQQKLQKLLNAIACLKYTVIEVEEEFVVYDSNLALDAGWIQS